MIVLALDTCLAACSAAVTRDGVVLTWLSEPMAREHQERLASMTAEVVDQAGLTLGDIDRIGVTVGPGSFTGLRVGLAFAKGLALALDRPCVGVGVLDALAEGLAPGQPVAAVIDAGRNRVYLRLFRAGAAVGAPDILSIDLALARLAEVCPSGEAILTGPGAGLLAGALPRAAVEARATPDPRAVAHLARLAPIAAPRPLYLRAPDAKVKGA